MSKFKVTVSFECIEDTDDWDDDYVEAYGPITTDTVIDQIEQTGTWRWLSKGFPNVEPTYTVEEVK